MKNYTRVIERILEQIHTNERFVLTSHVNPDGDGLGSELALYYFLKDRKKEVKVINASPVPVMYRFMDPDAAIFKTYDARNREYIIQSDVIFVLDISEMHRLGAVEESIAQSSAVRICIDHHSANNFPGDILFTDEQAVATGELVLQLIKQSGFQITLPIAESLYIALLTDTGCFRFSNTNARALLLGAELLASGVSHMNVCSKIYESNSWEKTRLFARTVATLKKEVNGKIAIMHITQDMMKETGTVYEDIEGFAEFARNIKDVLISILFVEEPDDKIKVSFRSGNSVIVDRLAAEFGGGGHKNASAAVIKNLTLSQAIESVIKAAKRYVENT
ncbi:hypothetical protein AMJ80_11270 [bacterium SM23_31]|nr:MAG: hypothetical protein AMJ80_11270 [bacterium SM23_31]